MKYDLKQLRECLKVDTWTSHSRELHHPQSRYLCHCEDEPFMYSKRCNNIGEAMQEAFDHVALRMAQSGCGDGLVYDSYTRRVIAVFGLLDTMTMGEDEVMIVGALPLPPEDELERMRSLVEEWDRHKPGEDQPPFVWRTWAG